MNKFALHEIQAIIIRYSLLSGLFILIKYLT